MVSPPCYACWSWLCSDQCLPGVLISDCSPSTQIGISRLFFELCRIPHEESEWEYDLFATFMMTHTYLSCQNFGSLDRKWKIETLRLQNSPETPTAGSFILLILKPVLKRESMMQKCIRMGDFHLIALPKNQILDTPNCSGEITPITAFRDEKLQRMLSWCHVHLQLPGVDHALKSMSSTCIQESGYIRKSWSLSDRNYLHLPNFLLASIKLLLFVKGSVYRNTIWKWCFPFPLTQNNNISHPSFQRKFDCWFEKQWINIQPLHPQNLTVRENRPSTQKEGIQPPFFRGHVKLRRGVYCWWFRNPVNSPVEN